MDIHGCPRDSRKVFYGEDNVYTEPLAFSPDVKIVFCKKVGPVHGSERAFLLSGSVVVGILWILGPFHRF